MSMRMVEIEDSLRDRLDTLSEEIAEEARSHLDQNPDEEDAPDLNDLDYSGAIHCLVDAAVPVYTKEIEDTWYLHASALEEAYENAGCGTDSRENSGMAAIYFYLDLEAREWYEENKDRIFEEWTEARAKAAETAKA